MTKRGRRFFVMNTSLLPARLRQWSPPCPRNDSTSESSPSLDETTPIAPAPPSSSPERLSRTATFVDPPAPTSPSLPRVEPSAHDELVISLSNDGKENEGEEAARSFAQTHNLTELRALARDRGLSDKGKKIELARRILLDEGGCGADDLP